MNLFGIGASYLGTGIEFVEALTIILAVGAVRGWKNALSGAISAIAVLAVLVAAIGAPLTIVIHVFWVQAFVGLFMLLFGIRWLRKALLRFGGLKEIHDEVKAYEKELERQRNAGMVSSGLDRLGFMTTFSGTFLEGLEAIFIVITFGLSSHSIQSSIIGALLAIVTVILMGLILRRPLSRIPENTLKFIVGVMLTSFGAFWLGESFNVSWPQNDLSIVYMGISLLLFSFLIVSHIKRKLGKASMLTAVSMEGQ